MTPEKWKQVKLLFQQVLEQDLSQEQTFLVENCDDEEVRKEVLSLLANHRQADEFLDPKGLQIDKPAANSPSRNTTDDFFNKMIGTKFNNTYLIEEKIGSGGMGAVFRATHQLLSTQVAIKVMSPNIITDSNYLKRFRREARAGWLLSHPNIIKVLEFSQSQDGLFFMVMEYIDGDTLKGYINKNAPVSLARTLEILEPLCNALDATHKLKILHRDLKPSNILISNKNNQEVIKLSDFGIIKLLERDNKITEEGAALTGTGTIIGTISYMSPEQIMNYTLTPASDIYSLGCIIYEMVTGELPIKGGNTHETLILKTQGKKIPAPSTKYQFLSKGIDEILQKTLSPNPKERYQKAGDLLQALKSIL